MIKNASITIIAFLCFNFNTQAQTEDYLNLKDSSLSLDCSDSDTPKIKQNIQYLSRLDTANINKNKHWYYYDLSMAHFKLYMSDKDTNHLRTASQFMLKASLIEFEFHYAVYNLALFHYWLKEFDQAEKHCNQYLQLNTDKSSHKDIKQLLKKIHKNKK